VLKIIIKKSSGTLFSELLGSTVFIQPGAAGTRGAPGAALHRKAGTGAVGTRGTLGAAGSWEPEPRGHAAPSELPCTERRVLPPKLPRAGLLLVVSGDFFLVASYCPTKNSRVLQKKRCYSSAFSPPPLLLRSRRRHGFFFDFFRPSPSVVMSGALQQHQLS
jgi:hypothetical protein